MIGWLVLSIYVGFLVSCIHRAKQTSGNHRIAMIALAVGWLLLVGWRLHVLLQR